GTVARVLKPMESNADRDFVLAHLEKVIPSALSTFWDKYWSTGWSMCIVVPPGTRNGKYFH
ncbi:hypothetical protein HDU82_008264, partial [Entophlyctis luteolus]